MHSLARRGIARSLLRSSAPLSQRRALSEAATALDPSLVKFLQVVPPLAFQVVILSPLQAIRKFREEGTTRDVSPVPYAAMCSNGAIWMSYGAMVNDPTIYLPNLPAFIMGGYYAQQFLAHKNPDGPSALPVYAGFGSIAAACGAIATTMPPESAAMTIGYIGSGVCVAMFSGPLLAIRTVLHERSARSIPPAFSLASTTNCALWTAYGYLVINDAFIWVPNAAGFSAGVTQLALYARFGTAPPAGEVAGEAADEATSTKTDS